MQRETEDLHAQLDSEIKQRQNADRLAKQVCIKVFMFKFILVFTY